MIEDRNLSSVHSLSSDVVQGFRLGDRQLVELKLACEIIHEMGLDLESLEDLFDADVIPVLILGLLRFFAAPGKATDVKTLSTSPLVMCNRFIVRMFAKGVADIQYDQVANQIAFLKALCGHLRTTEPSDFYFAVALDLAECATAANDFVEAREYTNIVAKAQSSFSAGLKDQKRRINALLSLSNDIIQTSLPLKPQSRSATQSPYARLHQLLQSRILGDEVVDIVLQNLNCDASFVSFAELISQQVYELGYQHLTFFLDCILAFCAKRLGLSFSNEGLPSRSIIFMKSVEDPKSLLSRLLHYTKEYERRYPLSTENSKTDCVALITRFAVEAGVLGPWREVLASQGLSGVVLSEISEAQVLVDAVKVVFNCVDVKPAK
ncbi:hypothetical protein HDU76_002763 [Blyttiomyces sp. JEL0837]|nr:hypothetical protein HDU76_002763 [Blyttiomyces sp. JEL0837]